MAHDFPYLSCTDYSGIIISLVKIVFLFICLLWSAVLSTGSFSSLCPGKARWPPFCNLSVFKVFFYLLWLKSPLGWPFSVFRFYFPLLNFRNSLLVQSVYRFWLPSSPCILSPRLQGWFGLMWSSGGPFYFYLLVVYYI